MISWTSREECFKMGERSTERKGCRVQVRLSNCSLGGQWSMRNLLTFILGNRREIKMAEKKDVKLTSSQMHQKIHLQVEQFSQNTYWKLAEDLIQPKLQEGSPYNQVEWNKTIKELGQNLSPWEGAVKEKVIQGGKNVVTFHKHYKMNGIPTVTWSKILWWKYKMDSQKPGRKI